MWDLLVSIPDHCLSFYFVVRCLDSVVCILVKSKVSTKF